MSKDELNKEIIRKCQDLIKSCEYRINHVKQSDAAIFIDFKMLCYYKDMLNQALSGYLN